MSVKSINNIECFDTKHEAPRLITVESSSKYNADDEWFELTADGYTYRIRAKDMNNAVANATRVGK